VIISICIFVRYISRVAWHMVKLGQDPEESLVFAFVVVFSFGGFMLQC